MGLILGLSLLAGSSSAEIVYARPHGTICPSVWDQKLCQIWCKQDPSPCSAKPDEPDIQPAQIVQPVGIDVKEKHPQVDPKVPDHNSISKDKR